MEYDPLEPVFDEVAAAKAGAPIIHDTLKPAATFPDLKYLQGRSGTNHPTTDEIRHYLSGNLCRCAAYPDIVQAVQAVSGQKSDR